MTTKPGLRQRKKMATMRRIQTVALDMFDGSGFENVTIEEIADGAEVSPSTVYRYFGTKEQIVLKDEFEPLLIEAVESELASRSPIDAMRQAISEMMTQFFDRDEELARRRTRYYLEEPALRAASLKQTDDFIQLVTQRLAQVSGRQHDDLEVQVTASMLVWSMITAVRHWHAGGYSSSLRDEMETALDLVEKGLG